MPDEPVRVSDAEREQVVDSLRDAVSSSMLTLEEFSERVGTALQATTRGELDAVTADLPAPAVGVTLRRRRARLTAAVLAHVVRRGQLRLGRRAAVLSVLADVDLDLRDAVVESGTASVTVLAVAGNADVYVPEGVDVHVSGFSLLGHRRDWGSDVVVVGAPAVHVRVLGLAGTVDVWRVPPGLPADHSAVIRELRERARGRELERGA